MWRKRYTFGYLDQETRAKTTRKQRCTAEISRNSARRLHSYANWDEKKVEEQNIYVSQPTTSLYLRKLNISRKRLKKVSFNANSVENEMRRRVYAREIYSLRNKTLLFLDETGFNLHTSSHYGYSSINSDAVKAVPGNRGKNLSFVALISIRNILSYNFV